MRLTIRNITTSLALTFSMAALVGCESKADKARKPGLVDSLVEQAVMTTDTGRIAIEDGADFRTRLRTVLMKASTKNLSTLKDHNVVVTLDQRLADQKNGFFDRRMDGVFYNGGAPTLALWDNGEAPGGFTLGMSTYAYGPDLVDKLAEGIRNGNADGVALAIAGRYKSGKHSYTNRWKNADDFDGGTTKKNEAILRKSPRRRKANEASGAGADW